MIGLHRRRYSSVCIQKIITTPLLIDPLHVARISESWYEGCRSIHENYGIEVSEAGLEVFTELFSSDYSTLNLGSSRHVLHQGAQIKGCGKTLPVDRLHPTMQTGRMSHPEACHSFIIAQLMNASLPLGSAAPIGVLTTEADHALYIRETDSFRLAQVDSGLSEKEKIIIRSKIFFIHKSHDPAKILNGIMDHLAAAFFLGLALPTGADNILIDGRLIDEEELVWTPRAGVWRISVEKDGDFARDLEKLCGQLLTAYQTLYSHSITAANLLQRFTYTLSKLWPIDSGEKRLEAHDIVSALLNGKMKESNLQDHGFSVMVLPTQTAGKNVLIYRKYLAPIDELASSNVGKRFVHMKSADSFKLNQSLHDFLSRKTFIFNEMSWEDWFDSERERLRLDPARIEGVSILRHGKHQKLPFQRDHIEVEGIEVYGLCIKFYEGTINYPVRRTQILPSR